MARTLVSAVGLLVVPIFFSCAGCRKGPWFCHEWECPTFTLVNEYEGFEQRYYDTSYWITTDIVSTSEVDVSTGFWKLYNFNQRENKEKKVIEMTRPVVVSVKEADGMGERQVSISFYQTAPDIAEPNDKTIRVTVVPGGIVYVRSFGGVAKYDDGMREVESLKEKLKAAGKLFNGNRFDAAGYDAPWELINRHNEIWLHAL
ncbi:heme-binding protein soul2 [Triplophysa rosa]|uniref:Heme-binding protein soul2 n=1 Tax=Triplophysa rosa TaxID=992332 RepID=A0A9W8C1P6_TRIRA|nr:heme-binding protein soul2 [Triplophysa rosa]KAI7805289.1 heme-binding protein soul2 precursor [Triplophysa rosa]